MHHIYSMVDYYYAGGKDKESDDKHVFIWIYYVTDLIHSYIPTIYQCFEHISILYKIQLYTFITNYKHCK